jgi:glucosamine 6-phosphate synthetase-like amidotransferase/phosphosugar isomerase protein
MSAPRRPFLSLSKGCGGWNTAAMTRRASPWAVPPVLRSRYAARRASSKSGRGLARAPLDGSYGIGHTRWATHGRPTEENAHPHRDCTGRIVVVHNGIVENYLDLKRELTAQGHKFVTETDTEIIAHMIEQVQKDAAAAGAPIPLEVAVRRAVKRLTGAFALGVLSAAEPDKIVVARFGPPVIIGVGEGESFVASDVPGILHHTRNIYFLADGDMAILTLAGVELTDFEGNPSSAISPIFCGIRFKRKRAATSTSCSRRFGSSRKPFATPRWAAFRWTQARSFWAR